MLTEEEVETIRNGLKHIRGVSYHRKTAMYLIRWQGFWVGSRKTRSEAIGLLEAFLETGIPDKPDHGHRKGLKFDDPTRAAVIEESKEKRRVAKEKAKQLKQKRLEESSHESSHSDADKALQQAITAVDSSQVQDVQAVLPSTETTSKGEPVPVVPEQSKAWKENQFQWHGYLEPLPRHKWPELQERLEESTTVQTGEILIGAMPSRCQFCANNQKCPNGYKPKGCSDYQDY